MQIFTPDELKVLRLAFDAAWDEVASDYDATPTTIEVGRTRLANAVLAASRSGMSEATTIKAVALRRMAKWRQESRVAL
jgi:hypothetical protein